MRGRASSIATAGGLALLAAFALPILGCSGGSAVKRPRLVLLVGACTVNRDYLAPYNARVPYTPTLAALARDGVVFERHRTESGQSGTSFASILSGSQAPTHGVYAHPARLDDQLDLLAESFQRAGWPTYFWFGHPMATPDLNYAQGVLPRNRHDFQRAHLRFSESDPPFRALLDGLQEDPDAKAFVQLTFTYTHGPYMDGRQAQAFEAFRQNFPAETQLTHAELERRFALYDKHKHELQWNLPEARERLGLEPREIDELAEAIEAAYKVGMLKMDAHLGLVVEALRTRGLLEDTLFVFTADHGQVLYREGTLFHWTHGMQLAPEVLDVPLILVAPGLLEPQRYANVTRSIDVLPTIASLAGVADRVPREGTDLAPALLGQAPAPELVAWSHTTTISPALAEPAKGWTLLSSFFDTEPECMWVAARRGDQVAKLRRTPEGEWVTQVFDRATDPLERNDRFDPQKADHARLRTELEAYKARLVEGFAGREGAVDLDASLERLRELGYVGR